MVLNRRMRKIPNMFVASLAISDFCLGAFTACPLCLTVLATSQWPFSDATCQYQVYMAITLGVNSIYTLTLMAVNRYFGVVKPAKYRRYFTKKKTMIMIIVTGFYSMCSPLPYMFSGRKMVFHPSKFFCYLQVDSDAFMVFMMIVYVGLPACVIFYSYTRIFLTVRSDNNNLQNTGTETRTVNVAEIKVARTISVIVVFFSLCWTPILVIDIVDTIRGCWNFPRDVYVAWNFLASISSALNPMIYGVLNKNFQKEYLKVLQCRYCHSHAIAAPLEVAGEATLYRRTKNICS